MSAYRRITPGRVLAKVSQYALRGSVLLAPRLFSQPNFTCPICDYQGPFLRVRVRADALCPKCGAVERHRLQKLALDRLVAEETIDFANARCLQIAPDAMTPVLVRYCKTVVTADVNPKPGSIQLDMCAMDIPDETFDMVYASHVLEHIEHDMLAVKEASRILRPNGIAIFPIPVTGETTVEYGAPQPHEEFHWRRCGLDYFDRYKKYFAKVKVLYSSEFPEKYHAYVYDVNLNRALDEHVPVCFKSA